MATYSRKELYELVWAQPMRTVAASIGVSDVAVAKACRKADIPVPERGYWARKQASKPTITRELPQRFPGASDSVQVGGGGRTHWGLNWREEALKEPIPSEPTYDEDLDTVTERARKMVGKVACPKQITNPHKLIAVLLERDEKRRIEYAKHSFSWHAPLYDSPSEKRRLRILNAIFTATQRLGCSPSMRTSQYVDNPETNIRIGDTPVYFDLEVIKGKARDISNEKERFRLSIRTDREGRSAPKSWEDTEQQKVEDVLTEIVVDLIVTAERLHREHQVSHRNWLIQRRAEIEAEIRREKEEAERRARELRAKQEKERIDSLVGQAHALNQSNTIREYVRVVRGRISELLIGESDFDTWAAWALNEADRIDPVKNGTIGSTIASLPAVASTSTEK